MGLNVRIKTKNQLICFLVQVVFEEYPGLINRCEFRLQDRSLNGYLLTRWVRDFRSWAIH
jgi:hypothetical protein